MPIWLATIVQVPKVSIVTFAPTTEQMDGVCVPKVTVSPDGVAVAVSGIGVELNVLEPGFVKLIVCPA